MVANFNLFSLFLVLFFFYHEHVPSLITSAHSPTPKHHRHHHHKWVGPVGCRRITVDRNGFGDFLSVQAAVESVAVNNRENVIIKINAGYYREKVVIPASKPYITLEGAGRHITVIEWRDRGSDRGLNGEQLPTYNAASVSVFANYFTARNISFKSTAPGPIPSVDGWQAAAFRISGDKAYFSGCGFLGVQNTLYDDAGRHYFKDCYIQGSIDFIFGNGRSMYKDCQLHSIATRFGSVAAQGRRSPEEQTGFAFVRCRVMGSGPIYVGRAMGQFSMIVYSYTYFANVVAPTGWDDWDHTANTNKSVFFGVYKCWGPGVAAARGALRARELDYETARPFLVKSFVNGKHWLGPADP